VLEEDGDLKKRMIGTGPTVKITKLDYTTYYVGPTEVSATRRS
jgi:hypothetical protein